MRCCGSGLERVAPEPGAVAFAGGNTSLAAATESDNAARSGSEAPVQGLPSRTRSTKQAKPPSPRLVAFSGAAVALMHAVPIGIVQFADYASDIGVLATFATSGKRALEGAMQSDPELFTNITVDLDYNVPPMYPPLGLDTARELAASTDGSTAALLEAYVADELSFRVGLGCCIASVSVVWIAAIFLLVGASIAEIDSRCRGSGSNISNDEKEIVCWFFTQTSPTSFPRRSW